MRIISTRENIDILKGVLRFLYAYDFKIHEKFLNRFNKVFVIDENKIFYSDEKLFLPEVIFKNAVTENIIFQLLRVLESVGEIDRKEINNFIIKTRSKDYLNKSIDIFNKYN